MPYSDEEKQRKYQKEWMREYRKREKERKQKIDEKWQAIKQRVEGGPMHKVTMCFACGKTKDCKAIFLCDECAKALMEATE